MSRPRRIDRDMVLSAALELVDRHGAEALTMRRLASQLHVEAMSIYGHVPSKDALLDGVVERIIAEVPIVERSRSWKAWVRSQLSEFRAALLRHPRAVTIVATRPVMTEPTFTLAEAVLAELQAIGLSLDDANRMLWIAVGFVIGHCLNQLAGMERGDGPTPAEVWTDEGIDLARFPSIVKAFGAERWSPEAAQAEFDVGVDLLLAGIARMLRRNVSRRPSQESGRQ